MHRYLILALLLASVTAHAATSLRVGNKVLTLGDSAARVLELMGQPTIRTFEHQQAGGLPNNQLAAANSGNTRRTERRLLSPSSAAE